MSGMYTIIRTLSAAAALAAFIAPAPAQVASHDHQADVPAMDGPEALAALRDIGLDWTLDTSRIAVMHDGLAEAQQRFQPRPAQVDDLLAQHGLSPIEASRIAHGGWQEVRVPEAERTNAGVATRLEALAGDPKFAFVSPVVHDEVGPSLITPVIFVQFLESVPNIAAEAVLDAHGLADVISVNHWGVDGLYKVRSTARSGFEVLAQVATLAQRPEVDFAEPNRVITGVPHGSVTPGDPSFAQSWHLHNNGTFNFDAVSDMDVNAPQAWSLQTGHPDIRVAVLDSGVQQDHPDINQETGVDETKFASEGLNGGPMFVFDNHGTPVAGIISGYMNNGVGSLGVCPDCRTQSFKIAYDLLPGPQWTSESEWIADGLFDAAAAGCRITNSSFRLSSSSILEVAYSATRGLGVLHFASAGNDSEPVVGFPASLPSTICVSAIGVDGELADFSNWGNGVDLTAPGVSIVATDRTGTDGYNAAPNGDYTMFGGTSAASPCAAGVAALVLAADPALTVDELQQRLIDTAMPLGGDGEELLYGAGLVRADAGVLIGAFSDTCPGSGPCTRGGDKPGCSDPDCCFTICDFDEFCCEAEWDQLCAMNALDLCYSCGATEQGPCAIPNGSPGCDNEACCESVCAADPTCCTDGWDSTCASVADNLCEAGNDSCGLPKSIHAGTCEFDTSFADTDGPDITCNNIDGDLWYHIDAPYDGTMTVSTCTGTAGDTKVAVYKQTPQGGIGWPCPTIGGDVLLSQMACADDTCGQQTFVSVEVQQDQPYWIRIGGPQLFGQPIPISGTFTVSFLIANDNCFFAQSISDGVHLFSTLGADTDGPSHPQCAGERGDGQVYDDVWYAYEATCDGELTVSTCGSADFDTRLAVYAPTPDGGIGFPCGGGIFGDLLLSLLTCNDDSAGCDGGGSTVIADVDAGETYFIRIGNAFGQAGTGTFSVSCAAPTPTCPADFDGDEAVGVSDLLQLLSAWGDCVACAEDLDDDDAVGVADLLELLSAWGPCG